MWGDHPRFAGLFTSAAAFGGAIVAAGLVTTTVGTDLTKAGPVVGIESPSWLVIFGIPALRTLLDLSVVSVAGLGLLSKLVDGGRPVRTEVVLDRARRLSAWGSAVWCISALVSIVLLSVELEPGSAPTPGSVWRYVGNIAAGKGLLLSAGCAVLSWALAMVTVHKGERVPAELRVGVALFGLLPLPLTGHAADWSFHDLAMISMELHVVAASAWAGGLTAVVLFLAAYPTLLAGALPRFSTLATWCVLVVGVTGMVNGLLQLALSPITHLPGSLLSTRYGVLLLGKAACLGIIGAIAVHVRLRVLPGVAAGKRSSLVIWCGWELLTLGAAFGIAVALTRASVTPF